jgi:hypothetical protein
VDLALPVLAAAVVIALATVALRFGRSRETSEADSIAAVTRPGSRQPEGA